MKTRSIGEILKEERQARRMSLEELAKRTRIRLEYLRSLEANDFPALPAATFVKGYIKNYSRVLGFDYQPLLALLRRDFKESARGKLVPREFIKPMLKRRPMWTPITVTVVILASVFFSVMGYVGWQWYNLQKPPALEIIGPADHAFVSSQIIVSGKTMPEAIVVVNAQPVAIESDGSFSTEVFIPREGITTITVEATDRRGKTNLVQRTVYVKF